MYERFTDRARKVMQLANQEAQRHNHDVIDPEHILLAICKEGSGIAATFLKFLGHDPDKLLTQVRDHLAANAGPALVTMGKLPQSTGSRDVIMQALETAKKWNDNYVGTEHLLAGVALVPGHESHGFCQSLGVTAEKIKEFRDLLDKENKSKPSAGTGSDTKSWHFFAAAGVPGGMDPIQAYATLALSTRAAAGSLYERWAALSDDARRVLRSPQDVLVEATKGGETHG